MAAMARGKRDGLVIAGGGLAGSLAALAMAKMRPEVPLLLVEESDRFGGDRLWTFFEGDIDEDHRWLVDPLVSSASDGHYAAFPDYNRKVKVGCQSVRSSDLDQAVREALRPDQYRLNTRVVGVRDDELIFPGGEKIKADGVVDARGAAHLSMLEVGWRKFVGQEYRFAKPHRVDMPVLADATVDQVEGYHFVYLLPLSEDRLLVEDTYYAERPDLDIEASRQRIEAYLSLRGWKNGTLEREEIGSLPVAVSDDLQALWRGGSARVAKLGVRGGFFHPFTGYSFADAVRTAVLLTEQRDFAGAVLHDLFERAAEDLWKQREYHRTFNSAFFGAPVWDRHKIMSAFYHLDAGTIGRFYTAKLGVMDRMRLSALKVPSSGR